MSLGLSLQQSVLAKGKLFHGGGIYPRLSPYLQLGAPLTPKSHSDEILLGLCCAILPIKASFSPEYQPISHRQS
jgi:hypothetical protein